jgi:hypothetical protein
MEHDDNGMGNTSGVPQGDREIAPHQMLVQLISSSDSQAPVEWYNRYWLAKYASLHKADTNGAHRKLAEITDTFENVGFTFNYDCWKRLTVCNET